MCTVRGSLRCDGSLLHLQAPRKHSTDGIAHIANELERVSAPWSGPVDRSHYPIPDPANLIQIGPDILWHRYHGTDEVL